MARQKKLLGAGLGAGLLGAIFFALKYAANPATKSRVPDVISPAVFRTKVLHTSLGQMVYHECGSGPTLVFIHDIGVGASSYEWSKVYPEFSGAHRVLAPDLVGFGESARPDKSISAADYARSLAEFLRATCDEAVTLVGSGLGAGFCVLLASQHPELVKRLVLLMPTGLAEFGQKHGTLGTRLVCAVPVLQRFLYRNYQSTRSAVRQALTMLSAGDGADLPEEVTEVYATCAQQYGAEHAIRNLDSGRLAFDLEGRLCSLTQPVGLLWGDAAPAQPLATAEHLLGRLSGATISPLPGAGRLAAIESPGAVAAALREQLRSDLRVFGG